MLIELMVGIDGLLRHAGAGLAMTRFFTNLPDNQITGTVIARTTKEDEAILKSLEVYFF
jgi:hypothetical protein